MIKAHPAPGYEIEISQNMPLSPLELQLHANFEAPAEVLHGDPLEVQVSVKIDKPMNYSCFGILQHQAPLPLP